MKPLHQFDDLTVHPYADCYPMISGEQWRTFCERVIFWSHSPVFSELARYTQKLVCKDLLDEETREKILYTITQDQNLFDFNLYDNILKTLPLIS